MVNDVEVAGFDGIQRHHQGVDEAGGLGLYGYANEHKPRLRLGASEADERLEAINVGEITARTVEVPEACGRVGQDWRQLQASGCAKQGDCYLRRQDLVMCVSACRLDGTVVTLSRQIGIPL